MCRRVKHKDVSRLMAADATIIIWINVYVRYINHYLISFYLHVVTQYYETPHLTYIYSLYLLSHIRIRCRQKTIRCGEI